MKWWIKFGCFLTGWNSNILSQCSEARHDEGVSLLSTMINITPVVQTCQPENRNWLEDPIEIPIPT